MKNHKIASILGALAATAGGAGPRGVAYMSMRDYLGYSEDELGEDEDILGAPVRGRRALGRVVHPGHARAVKAADVLRGQAGMQGIPQRQAVIEPLGFTNVQFTAATATTLTATAQPQKPVKGSRLVISDRRTATASGLVSLVSLKVGVREVLTSAQPVPADGFAPNAVGVALQLVEAHPGIIITATYEISNAPVAAEVVNIGTMLLCLSME